MWDPRELDRVKHVKELEGDGRRLSRRALLLHRDGYRVDSTIRKKAIADVLRRLRRPRHKMAQVQWELRALGGSFRPPQVRSRRLLGLEVTHEAWASVPLVASDDVFDRFYQMVDMMVRSVATMGIVRGAPYADPIPYEERLSLAMVSQLLEDNYVRNRLGLRPQQPRYGPPSLGEVRSARAPLLRGQRPPPRKSMR